MWYVYLQLAGNIFLFVNTSCKIELPDKNLEYSVQYSMVLRAELLSKGYQPWVHGVI